MNHTEKSRVEALESPDAIVARADRRRADTGAGRDYFRKLAFEKATPLEVLDVLYQEVGALFERLPETAEDDVAHSVVDAGNALRFALDRWPA